MSNEFMSESINELAVALCKAQGAISASVKGKNNPFFKSKYADLSTIWNDAKEACHANDLAISQIVIDEKEESYLHTLLLHSSGQWLKSKYLITALKDKSQIVTPQAKGSAITYARRYSLSSILGCVTDEDDDGEAAMARNTPQRQTLPPPKPKPVFESEEIRQQTKDMMIDALKEANSSDDLDELVKRYKQTFSKLQVSPDKADQELLKFIKTEVTNKRDIVSAEVHEQKAEEGK